MRITFKKFCLDLLNGYHFEYRLEDRVTWISLDVSADQPLSEIYRVYLNTNKIRNVYEYREYFNVQYILDGDRLIFSNSLTRSMVDRFNNRMIHKYGDRFQFLRMIDHCIIKAKK